MTMPEWWEEFERQAEEDRRRFAAALAAALPALAALGIARVVAYDGYGDQGAIERPVAADRELAEAGERTGQSHVACLWPNDCIQTVPVDS